MCEKACTKAGKRGPPGCPGREGDFPLYANAATLFPEPIVWRSSSDPSNPQLLGTISYPNTQPVSLLISGTISVTVAADPALGSPVTGLLTLNLSPISSFVSLASWNQSLSVSPSVGSSKTITFSYRCPDPGLAFSLYGDWSYTGNPTGLPLTVNFLTLSIRALTYA